MASAESAALIARLAATAKETDPGTRDELLRLSRALTATLETPLEAIQRTVWSEPARYACIREAIELRLFEQLAGARALTAAQLATGAGAETSLVSRVMKHLAATGVVGEPKPDTYAATALTGALTEPRFRDGVVFTHDAAYPAHRALPTFLKQSGHREPRDPVGGPFQAAHGTPLHFFPWLAGRPDLMAAFGNWMAGYSTGGMSWAQLGFPFPVREKLGGVADGDVLLVDVGGGQGHDLAEFHTRFPELKGKLVLQDKAEVVAQAVKNLPPGAEAAAHDFFTAQPVTGAKAYHLHSVLHDWPNEDCVRILREIKTAMRPGYSKLLINELVVPPQGADWRVTGMDFTMMVLGAVRERTEVEFRALLIEAGFDVVNVWYGSGGKESLIEAEVAS